MAFPFVFHSNFETGTVTDDWDSETDTADQLDVAHYTELSRFPWPGCVPHSGAYCLRATLSGGTADAFVQEGDINISAGTNNFFRFAIWLSPTFTGTADDTVNIFELQDTSNTVEATFGLRYVNSTGVVNFGIGETAPTSWSGLEIERGVWYNVELDVTVDSGGGDGTIDLYITREGESTPSTVSATQVASLSQNAVTHGVLGVQDHLATTTGIILFDDFIQDDARIFPVTDRWSTTKLLTKSGHAFVGHGVVEDITLMSGAGTDNVVSVYDTDNGNTDDFYNVRIELKNTSNNEMVNASQPNIHFTRGAYVNMTGTDARVLIQMRPSVFGDARVRDFGKAA